MKIIKINAFEKAIVSENGKLITILNEGTHLILGNKMVEVLNINQEIKTKLDLDLLNKNTVFNNQIHLIEVRTGEIALHFENNLLINVLNQGRYFFWKDVEKYKFKIINISVLETEAIEDKNILLSEFLAPYIRTYSIGPYEKGVLFVDGKLNKVLDPGNYHFFKNHINLGIFKADMRITQLDLSGQEILSKDKIALRLNFVAQYQIVDILKVVSNLKEFDKQVYIMFQLALREFVSLLTFDELLEKKKSISESIKSYLAESFKEMGLSIFECGIKDIIISGEIKDIMNQVIIAEKKAQANIILRREETASTRSLLNTAKLMEDNHMLYKLKEMEFVEKISEKINSLSISGNSSALDQLKELFINNK